MTHWVLPPPRRLCWWTGCEVLPFTMGTRTKRNTYHVCYRVRIHSAWTSWYRQGLNAVCSLSCSEWAKMTFLHLVQVCLELVNTSIVNWWDTSVANWWLIFWWWRPYVVWNAHQHDCWHFPKFWASWKGSHSPYIPCLGPWSYFWCVETTLFAFPLCFTSENEPALAFHVKSMRAAQFIKLDGRALNGGNWNLAYPSWVRKTKRAMAWGLAAPFAALVDDIFVSPST